MVFCFGDTRVGVGRVCKHTWFLCLDIEALTFIIIYLIEHRRTFPMVLYTAVTLFGDLAGDLCKDLVTFVSSSLIPKEC